MTENQEVTVRCGFRKIEIKDKNFRVNNQVILLNGVNHHDYNPREGRRVTREQMESDIRLMNSTISMLFVARIIRQMNIL